MSQKGYLIFSQVLRTCSAVSASAHYLIHEIADHYIKLLFRKSSVRPLTLAYLLFPGNIWRTTLRVVNKLCRRERSAFLFVSICS